MKKVSIFTMMLVFIWCFSSMAQDNYYRIGKGDVLEIIVWKEAELTKEVKVRRDGRISLPLIDDIMAQGKTPLDLKREIQKKLSRYITKPFVTVMVKEENSKFYMIGEVKKVGEYDLTKDVTVLQAIAMAGGFTEWADKNNIILLRFDGQREKRFRISYKDVVSGKTPNKNYILKRDDTIIVK